MSGNSNSPWGDGGGENNGSPNPWGNGSGNQKPPSSAESDFDRIVREKQDQLRKLMRGGGGDGGDNDGGGSRRRGGGSPRLLWVIAIVAAVVYAASQSIHFIQASDRAVVLRFGEYVRSWGPGAHFAFWPIETVEIENVDQQRVLRIGQGRSTGSSNSGFTSAQSQENFDSSLMLTSDENIIDIEFEVVWRIKDLAAYQFNLIGQQQTIAAVAQSSMREVVARSPLIPLLSTDRDSIAIEVESLIQENLDSYNSGIDILRVNLTKSDVPEQVIKDFEDVQTAKQERDTKRNRARAEANQALAAARGEKAQLLENAEAYRAEKINEAEGDKSRFLAVLEEYEKAPDVTRRRLYLETMERVYGKTDKVIIDGKAGEGVVPYLPLNELKKGTAQ